MRFIELTGLINMMLLKAVVEKYGVEEEEEEAKEKKEKKQ